MKAIWIDDDGFRSKSLIDLLDLYGINVEFCDTYETGINKIASSKDKIDVIILDIMMAPPLTSIHGNSQKTGIYLYNEIRGKYNGPIIFYSVLKNVQAVEELLKVDKKLASLNKPCPIEKIVETVIKLKNE